MLQVVGFLRGEEDVISGGINQSTPGQFRTGREGRQALVVEGKGGGRKKREGEGEAKLRYETMENLAIPPPSLSVVSVHGRTTGFRFLLPPLFLLLFISNPLPFLVREKRGRAAPRRGSQMNRFNEKMASQPRVGTRAGCRYTLPSLPPSLLPPPWRRGVGCFGSLIRNHCMNRGSNEIAAIKMMAVYTARVLDRGVGAGGGVRASFGIPKSGRGAHRIYPFDKN